MRQETNNEMDLLLRRLGRRQDTPASADHLDADELSLYAENVLPPAARARYTEHLADCARCRELVVQLSSSAGVVVAQETAKVFEPSALRKFLASLFSPMVLRYAVPALGLVVVAAIGFIVSRQQPGTNSPVARVNQEDRIQAPVPASQPEASSPAALDSPAENAAPANKRTAQSDTKTGAVPPPNAPPTVSTITAEVDQNAAKKVEQQPSPDEAPAASKPAAPDEAQRRDAAVRKENTAIRAAAANEPPPEKGAEDKKREAPQTGAVAGAAPAAQSRRSKTFGMTDAQSAGRPMDQQNDAIKDKNDADTRTVAGRRFRKQGNVWIDTAYGSFRSTIDLTRGSEQYRALVADEPAIKTIADQLDGEIIVVWKGRAYRIR
jgi:hypothetical protein